MSGCSRTARPHTRSDGFRGGKTSAQFFHDPGAGGNEHVLITSSNLVGTFVYGFNGTYHGAYAYPAGVGF